MITIVSYRPTWPAKFAEIATPLRQALGALALRIDHIGSTSVPGLAAKDRIDIQITVQSLIPAVEEALARAGYRRSERNTGDHIPPGGSTDLQEWTKWFFSPLDPDQAVNVHVRIQGRANQRYPLLFRDYLRAHPAIAEAYAFVSRGLSHINWITRKPTTRSKTPCATSSSAAQKRGLQQPDGSKAPPTAKQICHLADVLAGVIRAYSLLCEI